MKKSTMYNTKYTRRRYSN